MLEEVIIKGVIKKTNNVLYDLSNVFKQMRSDAERGDYFRIYSCLNETLSYFNNEEKKEVKNIAKNGIEDCLRLAMIDAERGTISRMNEYLKLASSFANLFNLNISNKIEYIETLGKKNEIIDNTPKIPHKKNRINRHAGYSDK
jgi:hypothetical protein